MTRNKLQKLKRELLRLRRSPQKAADIEGFAKSVGRKRANRGKEPTWESIEFGLFPITIPHHGSKDLSLGTKNSILDQLENDLVEWEKWLDEQDEAKEAAAADGSINDDGSHTD